MDELKPTYISDRWVVLQVHCKRCLHTQEWSMTPEEYKVLKQILERQDSLSGEDVMDHFLAEFYGSR